MAIQFFAHYLLNEGILTSEQMQEVLEHERSVRIRLGVLAMNAGFMTADQVEDVHALQRSQDKQFGAIAVEKGYLTPEQLEQLLAAQGRRNFAFIQAIADRGYLTLSQLEVIVADYRKLNGISEEEWASQKDAASDEVIRELMTVPQSGETPEVVYQYAGLLLRNIVRFLGDNPVVMTTAADQIEAPKVLWLVTQKIVGSLNLNIGLAMESEVLLEIARRFCGENLTEIDDLVKDSAGEFLNVHNGVFSSSLSAAGIEVDLLPQQIQMGVSFNGASYSLPIGLTFGQMMLYVSPTA